MENNKQLSQCSLLEAMAEIGGSKFIFAGSPRLCQMCKEIISRDKDIVEVLYEIKYISQTPNAWRLIGTHSSFFSTGIDN